MTTSLFVFGGIDKDALILYILDIYNIFCVRVEYFMNISISNVSGKPIYEQILEQIKAEILAGTLKEGDALPSMRLLAKELRISVITTKRAYEELERAGFIVSYTGKGSFVAAQNRELMREQKIKELEAHLLKACEIARLTSVSYGEMEGMLKLLYEEMG